MEGSGNRGSELHIGVFEAAFQLENGGFEKAEARVGDENRQAEGKREVHGER